MKMYIDFGDYIHQIGNAVKILKQPDDINYTEYLKWVEEGNTPIPKPPTINHDLIDGVWVLNEERKSNRELAEAKIAIRDRDIQLFELLLTLWGILRDKGLVSASDLPKELRDEVVLWKDKIDLIKGA